jgi:hypothetical protein
MTLRLRSDVGVRGIEGRGRNIAAGVELWTWCAYDIVGIGRDARS